jgi:PadR family transcriptional regulator PadR
MAELLGTFEQAVLLAIVRLGDDAYGRAILHQVQESLGRTLSAGAVYTTLDRLEQRGLIDSNLAEGTPIRGGRVRRYYSVVAEGNHALAEAQRALTKMWRGVKLPVSVKPL